MTSGTGRGGLAIAAVAVMLLATACKLPHVPPPPSTDVAVTQSVDNATPAYAQHVVFTTVVQNLGTATTTGVTVAIPLPNGLSLVSASPDYRSDTGVWTVGNIAAGAQATLALTARAGDVVVGDRTVTATMTAKTEDPNPANNSAASTVHVVPAHLSLAIVADPGNPQFIDISVPGTVGWTASVVNENDPTAPIADLTTRWLCATAGGNPCPDVDALREIDQPRLVFAQSDLAIDIYTLDLQAFTDDPNYDAPSVSAASVSFTTINSGG